MESKRTANEFDEIRDLFKRATAKREWRKNNRSVAVEMITSDTPTVQVSLKKENNVKGGATEMILTRFERYFNKEEKKGDQSDEHAY